MSERVDGAPVRKPHVKLVGEDGNAYAIIGRVRRSLREAGASEAYVASYVAQATSGDYANLLMVTLEYVDEQDEQDEE